jgi:hypothetical protein
VVTLTAGAEAALALPEAALAATAGVDVSGFPEQALNSAVHRNSENTAVLEQGFIVVKKVTGKG